MSDYGWVIDRDLLENKDFSGLLMTSLRAWLAAPVGPRGIGDDHAKALREGEGEKFRMFDGDGELYYEGRIVGDYTGFEPLYDFGAPNAGCTEIKLYENGIWQTL